ncbi:putative major facilitator superfamily transporter [Rosellinia necatrix]|uniref:Putative major facilitator superfamily transporter n=1 Tax=Rosellinia necatrix TaxID=77044 RepID=A0A1S8A7Z3_ROSNE|nr:putative major facilitator superfamily transporter [Rosellinia necatrix]
MLSYFIIANLAEDEPDVIRYAALLRGTESAWQAISYGLTSLVVFAEAGAIYLNFALWAVSILPAWLVLKHFGSDEVPAETETGIRDEKGVESRKEA